MMPKTFVIGTGLVTSLAAGRDESWAGLLAGRSGVTRISRFDPTNLPAQIAAAIGWAGPRTTHELALDIADRALNQALAEAALEPTDRAEAGLFVACAAAETPWRALIESRWSTRDELRDQLHLGEVIGAVPAALARRLGSRVPPVVLNTACASGATALIAAREAIADGQCELAIVVATDASVYEESIAKFALLSALSTGNETPEAACKPFSRDRDGFVMGEGAAAIVLASEHMVRRRGMPVLAVLSGGGEATDDFHRTRSTPDGHAIVGSMAAALGDAGLDPADIAHINAHGTGTPENDKMESIAIAALFGDLAERIPLTANKSQIGHMLTAAGLAEAVISILSLRNKVAPPVLNLREKDPDLRVNPIASPVALGGDHVLCNSFGFGGQNVSLIFSSAEHGR